MWHYSLDFIRETYPFLLYIKCFPDNEINKKAMSEKCPNLLIVKLA